MIILGVDPGPETCGVVAWWHNGWGKMGGRLDKSKLLGAWKNMPVEDVLSFERRSTHVGTWFPPMMSKPRHRGFKVGLVAIERMQSYGIAGSSLLRTSEVVGRVQQAAQSIGLPADLVYRREVLKFLDVTGKGNRDSLVRQRLIEMHGGSKQVAVGTKKKPGPLYGVSAHAWSALAVALTAAGRHE